MNALVVLMCLLIGTCIGFHRSLSLAPFGAHAYSSGKNVESLQYDITASSDIWVIVALEKDFRANNRMVNNSLPIFLRYTSKDTRYHTLKCTPIITDESLVVVVYNDNDHAVYVEVSISPGCSTKAYVAKGSDIPNEVFILFLGGGALLFAAFLINKVVQTA